MLSICGHEEASTTSHRASSVFFLAPSAVTGFFYFRINQVLKRPSAERHAKRNATVTMAFRGNWILWVASWTPAYVVLMAFSIANFEQYTTFGIILNSFIIYTMQFVFPIQMLHSHVNPIFYLLTIKDFKDCAAKWTKRIGSIIICTKNGDRTKSGIEERRFKPSVQSRILVSPFLLLVGFLCLIPASLYLSLMIETNQSHSLPLSTKLTAEASSRIIEEKVKQYSSDADIVKNIHLHNVREKCSATRGVYNYQMRRCYFILHHAEPGLNFSAQVSACRMKGAPVLRSHRSSSMAIAVPWGPSMAINGPSMGIDEVFLTLIPSMGHRWTIDDPSMEIEIFDHKNSFDLAVFKISTKLWPFKFFIQSI